ncbi:hypothetical protein GW915_06575 [bacterium]|nr:hypothetical protein [bacterium]
MIKVQSSIFLITTLFFSFFSLAQMSPAERLERPPHLQSVEMVYNVPYIEVFATGRTPLDCFNKKQIDISIEQDTTYIVPRFIFIANGEPCSNTEAIFSREKIADLDPSNPASYKVAVLGFEGWHYYNLKEKSPSK